MRVVWWFATLTVVSFATILLSEENAFDPFKNVALTVSAPVESAARDAASPPDGDALRRHCETGLAPYKVPREFRFLDDLPKSGVGKVLKTKLRERFESA